MAAPPITGRPSEPPNYGHRLDLPANGSVRIEPGTTVEIALVPIGGARVIRGFQGAVDGSLDESDMQSALDRLIARGFEHEPSRWPRE